MRKGEVVHAQPDSGLRARRNRVRAQRLVNISDWIRVVTREALDCDFPADGAAGLTRAPTDQAQAAGSRIVSGWKPTHVPDSPCSAVIAGNAAALPGESGALSSRPSPPAAVRGPR